MGTLWIPIFLSAAAAANGGERHDPDLVVYLNHGPERPDVMIVAQAQAKRILASVGVSVEWRIGTLDYQGPAEVIEAVLTEAGDPLFKPGALAFATLGVHSGPRIEVFSNRIRAAVRQSMTGYLLGHVLVHEITHVLEGVPRHSPTGMMKAHWEDTDYEHMRWQSLPFAEEDIRLIHAWSERHNRALMATVR